MKQAADRFGAIYAQLEAELDWELLGRSQCEGDGSGFFDAALRERILDQGLLLADDLAGRLDPAGARRSLYVGAATAELPLLLVEQLLLQREVHWLNVDGAEVRELQRALQVVSRAQGIELALPGFELELAAGGCDHLWIVSVLNDPEHFPALHDELYERSGSELATGRGSLDLDRERAEAFGRQWLGHAAPTCLLSTTDEELRILAPLCAQAGRTLQTPEQGRISAVVGDRVLLCRLS